MSQHQWAAKYGSRYFGHGKNMMCCIFCSTAEYPRCQASSKDKVYVVTCLDSKAHACWEKALHDIQLWLQEHHTCKANLTALIKVVNQQLFYGQNLIKVKAA